MNKFVVRHGYGSKFSHLLIVETCTSVSNLLKYLGGSQFLHQNEDIGFYFAESYCKLSATIHPEQCLMHARSFINVA